MGDQYSGDEVRWYWLGCESGCSVSDKGFMNIRKQHVFPLAVKHRG